jgi:hypothetical protein
VVVVGVVEVVLVVRPRRVVVVVPVGNFAQNVIPTVVEVVVGVLHSVVVWVINVGVVGSVTPPPPEGNVVIDVFGLLTNTAVGAVLEKVIVGAAEVGCIPGEVPPRSLRVGGVASSLLGVVVFTLLEHIDDSLVTIELCLVVDVVINMSVVVCIFYTQRVNDNFSIVVDVATSVSSNIVLKVSITSQEAVVA